MAVRQIQTTIRLQVPAGEANPSPPVGPALGQHGLNIMDFCKAFNAQTADIEKGLPLPVVISVYADRSFDFICKQPPASVLLRKAAGIAKGSGEPNRDKVGRLNRAQLEEVARRKMQDMNANDIDAAVRILAGSCRSAGIEVEGVEGMESPAIPAGAGSAGDTGSARDAENAESAESSEAEAEAETAETKAEAGTDQ